MIETLRSPVATAEERDATSRELQWRLGRPRTTLREATLICRELDAAAPQAYGRWAREFLSHNPLVTMLDDGRVADLRRYLAILRPLLRRELRVVSVQQETALDELLEAIAQLGVAPDAEPFGPTRVHAQSTRRVAAFNVVQAGWELLLRLRDEADAARIQAGEGEWDAWTRLPPPQFADTNHVATLPTRALIELIECLPVGAVGIVELPHPYGAPLPLRVRRATAEGGADAADLECTLTAGGDTVDARFGRLVLSPPGGGTRVFRCPRCGRDAPFLYLAPPRLIPACAACIRGLIR